jgi:hypothetical protein
VQYPEVKTNKTIITIRSKKTDIGSHVEFITLREIMAFNEGTHLMSEKKKKSKCCDRPSPLSSLLVFSLLEFTRRHLLISASVDRKE